uniref:Peptidase n=1 Tax=Bacillus phage KoopaTroopa TaxID=3234046 RepID=A0AB39C7I7_9CAUD
MAKMTVREALQYVVKAHGTPYTDELQSKIVSFLHKLPHHPYDIEYASEGVVKTVRDYDYGWYASVLVYNNNGKMHVEVIDGDNLDPNPQRVKSNTEALQVMKELSEVKWASDIDEYWNMSDDHKYWSRMSDMNMQALHKTEELKNKLA